MDNLHPDAAVALTRRQSGAGESAQISSGESTVENPLIGCWLIDGKSVRTIKLHVVCVVLYARQHAFAACESSALARRDGALLAENTRISNFRVSLSRVGRCARELRFYMSRPASDLCCGTECSGSLLQERSTRQFWFFAHVAFRGSSSNSHDVLARFLAYILRDGRAKASPSD